MAAETFLPRADSPVYFVLLICEEEPAISFPGYNEQSDVSTNIRQTGLGQQQQPQQPQQQQQQSPGAMQFAWNLMKSVVLPKQENTVICPILPQTLLATLHDAADNVAKAELRSSVLASSRELGKLVRSQIIATQQSGVNKLDQAMAIFLGENTKISLPIEKNAREDGVEILQVNFQNRNAAAAAANNWVTKKSKGSIREIVGPNTLDPATRMIMASVIYFKGKWKHQFTKTEPGLFETSDSSDNTKAPAGKMVPMMYQYNKLRYGEKEFPDGNGMRWVELPYEGSAGLSMVLMLPKVRHQLQRSADQLDIASMTELIASLKQNRGTNKMHLHVPKFNMFSSLSLVPALKSLGLRSIFERASALKGLTNEQLIVRDVSQRTYISIDEQGTKAVSAAALSFVALSAAPPPPTINFTVNEPFLLMIVDKTNEYPLFVGKIVNPESN
ncbi:glia-derived nexin-like [Anopheles maculipalpis]|uniref:glia-derived nexin-like n=1 Tax=Anopheles maculipalpis TaxID=1496333 RepID=UPI0021590565|nr:glia-derived nexin-like [Anopheles maculipalpis]